ncbi:MAG: MYXO-CTERM sorting domain-containing protein [Sandaracinaceae bacterium]
MPFRTCLIALVAVTFTALLPGRASAANILFVADGSGDGTLPSALSVDGHTVEMVVNDYSLGSNTRLRGELSPYDAIYWSATGGQHTDALVFANLDAFVRAGGRLFVTGFDALDSFPSDGQLFALLGGTGSRDTFTSPSAIGIEENALTAGVVDIRGLTPTGSRDNDCLSGLGPDTLLVASNGGDVTCAQWSLRTLGAGLAAWVSAGSASVWTDTSVGGAGAYNAAARNFAAGSETSSREPGAPFIDFIVPAGLFEGDEVTVTVSVEDFEGDAVTFSWDLDDDETFGENEGEFSYTLPEGMSDGPDGTRLGVEAIDANGNRATLYRSLRVLNVPPTVTSDPPAIISILADMDYQIEVDDPAGDLDAPSFELIRGPDRMSVSDTGRVSWVPNESDVTAVDETVSVDITIDDGDGGVIQHAFELIVSPNRQPTAPTPSYPIDMIGIIDPAPRLAAQNSEDLDLDELRYIFQIDTVDTFDSENLRESPALEETPGFTAWQLEEPLGENRAYFWRVRADDGLTFSPWREAGFFVVRDPSLPPPDAGPIDAGPPPAGDGGVIPGLDGGLGGGDGGCSVDPVSTPGSSWLFGLVALGLVGWRRRRAR